MTVPLDDRAQLLHALRRLAGSLLPGRHDRPGAAGNRPQTAQAAPAELTETPEIPTLGCLPERGAWGKFGQVATIFDESSESARRSLLAIEGGDGLPLELAHR